MDILRTIKITLDFEKRILYINNYYILTINLKFKIEFI